MSLASNNRDTIFYDTCEFNTKQPEEFIALRDIFFKNRIKGENDKKTFMDRDFGKDHVLLYKRNIFNRPREITSLMGPCQPGQRKLYVASDGTFYPCEKINAYFPIGDIHRGFAYDKIRKMWINFANLMNEKECLNCWAIQLCGSCFATIAKDGNFKIPNKKRFCEYMKLDKEKTMKEMAILLEENPNIAHEWDNVYIM